MPPNVSALLPRAAPGLELSCRAQSHRFREGPAAGEERGVLSYYAFRALRGATTMETWSRQFHVLCQSDVVIGRLPETMACSVIVAGDRRQHALGPVRP